MAEIRNVPPVEQSAKDIWKESKFKKSITEAIDLFVESCKEFGDPLPEILKGEYRITFDMDVQNFLKIYEGIFSESGLEHLTGINQKQLWHYANCLSRPREAQRRKIENALH